MPMFYKRFLNLVMQNETVRKSRLFFEDED